jgi:ribonuclease HI
VKSGYHVARITERMANHASSSHASSGGGDNTSWNLVWRVRVPPKVRNFVWRLIRGILPTRVALNKKFPIPDTSCIFCNQEAETDLHLFCHCDALSIFWKATTFGVDPIILPGQSILEWINGLVYSLSMHDTELLFMCLWVLWTERNRLMWNGGTCNPYFMATCPSRLLDDYLSVHPHKGKKKKRPISYWCFPPSGRLKINVDGSFHAASGKGGIGVIIRNEDGRVLAALQRSLPFISSAFQAEAEACRAGLKVAMQQGWDNIIVETDCAILATALAKTGEDLSDIGRIIGDCKEYFSTFNYIDIRHIFREANGVANRLAHIASYSNVDELWLDETPSIIEDVLYEDNCCPTRGLGITPPSQ